MEPYEPYRAYLIRLWKTQRGGVAGYRATAEDVATGECRHFPDLEGLFAFLKANGDAESEDRERPSDLIGQEDS